MFKEAPNKKNIDLSSFLNELYRLKDKVEQIIIHLEELIGDDDNV